MIILKNTYGYDDAGVTFELVDNANQIYQKKIEHREYPEPDYDSPDFDWENFSWDPIITYTYEGYFKKIKMTSDYIGQSFKEFEVDHTSLALYNKYAGSGSLMTVSQGQETGGFIWSTTSFGTSFVPSGSSGFILNFNQENDNISAYWGIFGTGVLSSNIDNTWTEGRARRARGYGLNSAASTGGILYLTTPDEQPLTLTSFTLTDEESFFYAYEPCVYPENKSAIEEITSTYTDIADVIREISNTEDKVSVKDIPKIIPKLVDGTYTGKDSLE